MIMVKDMKKGFTLIELLTVIVILGIIAAITVPTVVDLIRGSRIDACEEQKSAIEAAAQRWHTETNGEGKEFNEDETMNVSVSDLQEAGYLDNSNDKIYQNPIDDSDISETNVKITRSRTEENMPYKYDYELEISCEFPEEDS